MPSTNFRDAWEDFATMLTTAGVANVVIDPRNATPPCVIVDAPALAGISASLWRFDFNVLVLAPPPGNADALKSMLDVVDAVAAATPTATGQPGVFTTAGGAEIPCYRLTCPTTYQRS